MFQGKCVDGRARYLQQSIFARLGLVLWICVGGGLCVAERNILVTLGCFLACPISQHRYMLESRLISPLLTDTHPKSPQHKTTKRSTLSSTSHLLSGSIPCLLFPHHNYRSSSCPLVAGANSHSRFRQENADSDGC